MRYHLKYYMMQSNYYIIMVHGFNIKNAICYMIHYLKYYMHSINLLYDISLAGDLANLTKLEA